MLTKEAGDLWIFAYGSLMWRPDFDFVERRRARLSGFHRALCVSSNHWRGTKDRPGLVLGLDRGGSCVGIAFRIAAHRSHSVLAAVRDRELVSSVYREVEKEIALDDGRVASAVTYVADRSHVQYAGKLDQAAMLERVRHSSGVAGPNVDYVSNTHAHLKELGVDDRHLTFLVRALGLARDPGMP